MRTSTGAGGTRRQFLQTLAAGALVGLGAKPARGLPSRPIVGAQTSMSPDEALEALLAGNRRFAADQLTSIEQDLRILKEHAVEKQEPFAGALACADSRCPVELFFDQTIGHLFVTRVAGSFVTPEIIASLEYGVAVLGIRALLVLGHTNCGAVKAAMKADA